MRTFAMHALPFKIDVKSNGANLEGAGTNK